MMQLEDICAMPVKDIQAEQCILFLWVTAPRLPMAFDVMDAWGFQYHSLGFDWLKVSKEGKPMWGPGYYTRQNNEMCLIGVPNDRKRRIKPISHSVIVPVIEQRREHDDVAKTIHLYDRFNNFTCTSGYYLDYGDPEITLKAR